MTAIFEDVLRDLLRQTNLVDDRVFLLRAPQKPNAALVQPYIVFTPTGPEPDHMQAGPTALLNRNYQISIFDQSQSRCLAVADGLREALDGYSGLFEGVRFGSIIFRLQSTQHEADTRIFQTICEFRFRFRIESLPAVTTAVTTKQGV